MRKHFHYGSQYRKEVTEVTREGASSTFSSGHIKQQEMNVCMEPFFPYWLTEPIYTIFITKVILISRETDDRWHLSWEWRYTLFRWSFGYTDWIINTTRHKSRKLISPHAHLRPNCNNTSKKDWNCARLRRAEHLSPQHPTLSDFHYQTHTTLNLKICNKTDLNVKNCLFSKNNCRNIWIIQIKVVTLHHQNNNSNNN